MKPQKMKASVLALVPFVLSVVGAQEIGEHANITPTKPCFEKGEVIRASFDNIDGEGVWIGLYPRENVNDFEMLPNFSEGSLSEWILTCGRRDNCDEWPSTGNVIFDTDKLDYGEYVITVSGDRADMRAQAHSKTFIVDAHCPELHTWRPPHVTDQRSPCPFLNTAANHGFLNRNGTNIDINEMANQLEALYNVAADFLLQGPIQQMIDCNQTYQDENGVTRFDLEVLFDEQCEEHEASMVRADNFFGFEKSKEVDDNLLNNLMRRNPGKSYLTLQDVFDYQADRIMASRLVNPEAAFRDFDVGNMGAQGMFLFLLSSDETLRTVEKNRLYFFLLDEMLPDDFVPGALRETPFNPFNPLDFMHHRHQQSMNNVETMMHLPIVDVLRGHHTSGGEHDHGL